MEFLIKTITVNFSKMFRRPLYRVLLIVLNLPVSLYVYFVYRKRNENNSYQLALKKKEDAFNKSEESAELRSEIESHLKNKLEFLNKSYDNKKFQSEVQKIYKRHSAEIIRQQLTHDQVTSVLSETSFTSIFSELITKPLFKVLAVLLGWPMLVLVFIYANAYSKFVMERTVMMVFVIFGVTFLVFTILFMSPLDAGASILGVTATQNQIDNFNNTYGLNKSYVVQLVGKFRGLVTFNLGKSYQGNEDVFNAIMRKFPATLEMSFYSLILALIISIPAGIISAIKQYTLSDYAFMFLALLGLSIPAFWLGYILILNLSINNSIFPPTYNADNWKSLIMPAIVLGTGLAATVTRMTRSSLLEVVNQDYIVTAKAKGLSSAKVIFRHALPNAMIPIITVIGLQFGSMLGGSAVTEKVFNVNGIGKYIVDKQFIPDIPVVLAGVVYVAVIISFINLFVDILYAFFDPRIKSKLKSY